MSEQRALGLANVVRPHACNSNRARRYGGDGRLPEGLVIRLARASDLGHMQEIERAAGAAFRGIGMHAVADDPPLPLQALADYQVDRRAWVATDDLDAVGRPVAYMLVDVVDGAAHVEQISVHPDHAGRRLGCALLDIASSWAVAQKLSAVTLTTFTQVPWNGPYYARLGFRYLADDELGPGLRRLRALEAAHGLDRWSRSAMLRDVRPTTPRGNHMAHTVDL